MYKQWYIKAKKEGEGFNDVELSKLTNAQDFDQSYLNNGQADQVLSWHNNTYESMKISDDKEQEAFFHPS